MAVVRLFAAARIAAGTGTDQLSGGTVDEVLAGAVQRYGEAFRDVLEQSHVWLNGEPAAGDVAVGEADEVAILPPVSGGDG